MKPARNFKAEWCRSGVRGTDVVGVVDLIPHRPCQVALTENKFQYVSLSNSNLIVT